ncbi:anti-sigma regulatory factor [Dyadobacter fermentans]|uniref:Putative anti-sigma regulatory factor, serine/threonine protein kinase n=1 Tax=Dyadobacter fermentans (strain ATCC 700827 / DSM 18053 / CIP 107007 / KCTC 52180 / NS114) TaxID=471854 RepID=C6VTH2_DYAFD|nr:anti-sigma regulatory factor [Dyadobacter fermentans]ACT92915.1 putative anti-sigma regulatory factor, serine/threonine protein kinase [Dyadobacter fermentans DSM 18053]
MLTTTTNIREILSVRQERDVVICRNRVKEVAAKLGMGIVNQTKLITAVSELARNMLIYGGGGNVLLQTVTRGREPGVQLIFEDKGPGIADIKKAMQDGFTTGKSMGMGLPGAKRLVSEFSIDSTVGKGTTVKIIKWKNG